MNRPSWGAHYLHYLLSFAVFGVLCSPRPADAFFAGESKSLHTAQNSIKPNVYNGGNGIHVHHSALKLRRGFWGRNLWPAATGATGLSAGLWAALKVKGVAGTATTAFTNGGLWHGLGTSLDLAFSGGAGTLTAGALVAAGGAIGHAFGKNQLHKLETDKNLLAEKQNKLQWLIHKSGNTATRAQKKALLQHAPRIPFVSKLLSALHLRKNFDARLEVVDKATKEMLSDMYSTGHFSNLDDGYRKHIEAVGGSAVENQASAPNAHPQTIDPNTNENALNNAYSNRADALQHEVQQLENADSDSPGSEELNRRLAQARQHLETLRAERGTETEAARRRRERERQQEELMGNLALVEAAAADL